MGHVRLSTLPTSQKWRDVVALPHKGALADQTAEASAKAAALDLKRASKDLATNLRPVCWWNYYWPPGRQGLRRNYQGWAWMQAQLRHWRHS